MYPDLRWLRLVTVNLLLSSSCFFVTNYPFPTQSAQAQIAPDRRTELTQIYQLLGTATPDITTLRGAELGEQITQAMFKDAEWLFLPDGQFVFIPLQPGVPTEKRLFVSGTYARQGERLIFQGERLAKGDGIFLDGTIQRQGDQTSLRAIYAISANGKGQQISILSQQLSPQPSNNMRRIDVNRLVAGSKVPAQTPQQAQALPNPRYDLIEGIRVPSEFAISVQGQTEAGAFPALPGSLSLLPTEGLWQEPNPTEPLSVNLLTTTAGVPQGDVQWLNLQKGTGTLQISNGQLRLELKSSQLTPAVQWWTIPQGADPQETVLVYAARATLSLTIQGDTLTGSLTASGLYNAEQRSQFNQPSTYQATITGKRIKSDLAESIRTTLGTSAFTGRWLTGEAVFGNARLGQLELRQTGQQVRGTYTGYGGGHLEGTLQGNRLNFTWQDKQRGKGQGFFRAIAGGGTLVGSFTSGLNSQADQLAIATWQLPLPAQSLSPLDLSELRDLAFDLSNQGRCEQAAPLFSTVVAAYRQNRQKVAVSGAILNTTDLINESFALELALTCLQQIGDYTTLLSMLDQAIEVGQYLAPGESARRLFRERIKTTPANLTQRAKALNTIQTNLEQLRGQVRRIGIGITLQQQEKTREVVVVSLLKDSPAAKAGIQPQDKLVQIDGQSIQGLTLEQITQRLRGSVGTPVALTVQRGTQLLDFKLLRARLQVQPRYRQADDLLQDITDLTGHLQTLQTELAADQQQIQQLEQDIGSGKVDPIQAFDILAAYLKQRQAHLLTQTLKVGGLNRNFLKGQAQLLQESTAFLEEGVRRVSVICPEPAASVRQQTDIDIQADSARAEQFLRSLAQNTDLTDTEKQLFDQLDRTVTQMIILTADLSGQCGLIQSIDVKRKFKVELDKTLNQASRFMQFLETWRRRLVNDFNRINVQEQAQPFFQKLIQFLVEIEQRNDALVVSEKSRGRAFLDLLLTRFLSDQTAQANVKQVSSEQIQQTVQNQIRPITLEQIQQIAKDQDATLVQYAVASKENLYIWVVQPNGKIHFQQSSLTGMSSSLTQLIFDSRDAIGARGRADVEVQLTPEALKQRRLQQAQSLRFLYQLLIKPITPSLPNNSTQRVIFIPQNELFLVPFAALQDEKGKYLIENYTILTAPSIEILRLTRLQLTTKRQAPFSEQAFSTLIVGNPTMPKVVTRVGEPPRQLADLPGAKQEAIEIAKLFNTQAITGSQATESTIVQQMSNARIIHLATHGLLDDFTGLGMPGAIALAPSGNGQLNDGLLTANKILDLKLQAELVVLSACDTGRGRITGDGVIGLSRSLITAGVPSIVVSLWKVPDDSTALLMTEFYKNLKITPDKAQALRRAMLTTKAKYADPLHWAAFTLIGEAE